MSGGINGAMGNRGAVILMRALAIIASSRLPVQARDISSIAGLASSAAGEPVVDAYSVLRQHS